MPKFLKQAGCFIYLFLMVLGVTGCEKSSDIQLTEKHEYQKRFGNGNYFFNVMCQNDTGYYTLLNGYLFYLENNEALESIVVCGKIECDHSTSSCNGYIGAECDILSYNDKIYYTVSSPNSVDVYQIDFDGTNRKKYHTIPNKDNLMTVRYLLHRGHFFYISEGIFVDNTSAPVVKKISESVLDNNPMGEYALWADGSYVYIESYNEDYCQILYRYSIDSQEFTEIWKTPSPSEVGEWATAGIGVNGWYINNDVIYFFLSGNGVWKTDLLSGKTECVFKTDVANMMGYASFDDTKIYIDTGNMVLGDPIRENHTIHVFDYTGSILDSYVYGHLYSDGINSIMITGTDETKVFLAALFSETITQYGENVEITSNEEGIFCIDMKNKYIQKVLRYSDK